MSAIIIGLGSAGRAMVEKIRQLHLQFTGIAKPDDVDYLAFDAENALDKNDGITRVWMSFNDLDVRIPILKWRYGTE